MFTANDEGATYDLDLFGEPIQPEEAALRRPRDEARQRLRVLVLVKAYPALSTKHGEVVCVAGLRLDQPEPAWIRLFPVDFRGLPATDKFKKYQVVEVEVFRPRSDLRPESWSPRLDSIRTLEVVDASHGWSARKALIEPARVESMCWIQRQQQENGTSLGMFQPRSVDDFEVLLPRDAGAIRDSIRRAIRERRPLFGPDRTPLEASPFEFRYRYRCWDEACRGHSQSYIDWEVVAAALSWRKEYEDSVLRDKLRERFFKQVCHSERDVSFFVGNMHQNPVSFLVLGVFWPPRRDDTLRLF